MIVGALLIAFSVFYIKYQQELGEVTGGFLFLFGLCFLAAGRNKVVIDLRNDEMFKEKAQCCANSIRESQKISNISGLQLRDDYCKIFVTEKIIVYESDSQ